MKQKIIQFITLFLLMLIAGLFWGTWFFSKPQHGNIYGGRIYTHRQNDNSECGKPNEVNYAFVHYIDVCFDLALSAKEYNNFLLKDFRFVLLIAAL